MKIEVAMLLLAIALVLPPVALGWLVTVLDNYTGRELAVCLSVPLCTVVGIIIAGMTARFTARKV